MKNKASKIAIAVIWLILHIIITVGFIVFCVLTASDVSNGTIIIGTIVIIALCMLVIAPYLYLRDSIIELFKE